MLICPLFSTSQNILPLFENDTLYTRSGYKIFSGLQLQFNSGTERNGKFKYVSVKNGILSTSLINRTVVVNNFKKFWISGINNGYIIFDGYLIRKDGTRDYIILQMAFDRAIENSTVLPSEILVPIEFRNQYKRDLNREYLFLYNMYKDKVISKTAYTAMKQKLDEE